MNLRSRLSSHGFSWRLRRHWQNPEAILSIVGLKPNQVFMDIGCGDGFFAIPAARIVSEKGRIYALDVDKDAISVVEERAKKEGLKNIVTRVGKAEKTVFCEACGDIIFLADDLHDFEDPSRVLANARRMVKAGGRLVDVDWKKKYMLMPGPPIRIRPSETEASNLIKKAGFEIEIVGEAGPYHYIIIAKTMSSQKLAHE
jgi:ubiquinone/menaquinone biosynthesis C-methylase UbiE